MTTSTRLALPTAIFLDISDLTQPRLRREYTFFGHPGTCAFWKGRLVIPAGCQGLLLERK